MSEKEETKKQPWRSRVDYAKPGDSRIFVSNRITDEEKNRYAPVVR